MMTKYCKREALSEARTILFADLFSLSRVLFVLPYVAEHIFLLQVLLVFSDIGACQMERAGNARDDALKSLRVL